MSLLTDLGASLASTVRGLTSDFGVRVTVYRPTRTTQASGQVTRSYSAPDATLTNVPGFFAIVESDGMPRAQGVIPVVRGTLALAVLPSGAIPVLDPFDGVKILDGPFAGYTFLCDAESVPDGAGLYANVALTSAPAGVLP